MFCPVSSNPKATVAPQLYGYPPPKVSKSPNELLITSTPCGRELFPQPGVGDLQGPWPWAERSPQQKELVLMLYMPT